MTKNELHIKLNQWFQDNWEHYRSEVGKNIAWGQMSEYKDDLCIQCYEDFMNKKEEAKLQMYQDDKILNFLLYCASFQIRSGQSPFYKNYRQGRVKHIPEYFAENEQRNKGEGYELDDVTLDDYYQCAMKYSKEEHVGWYYAKLIELKYLQRMSFQDIAEKYGMPMSTLKRDTKLALEAVKQKCNHL